MGRLRRFFLDQATWATVAGRGALASGTAGNDCIDCPAEQQGIERRARMSDTTWDLWAGHMGGLLECVQRQRWESLDFHLTGSKQAAAAAPEEMRPGVEAFTEVVGEFARASHDGTAGTP